LIHRLICDKVSRFRYSGSPHPLIHFYSIKEKEEAAMGDKSPKDKEKRKKKKAGKTVAA